MIQSWKKLAILNALIVLFVLTTVMGLSKNQQQSSLRTNSNPSNAFGMGKLNTGIHSSGARGKYGESSKSFSSSENTQQKVKLIDSENREPVYVTPNITELFETIRKRGNPYRYRLF
ncbi:hypothetical protein ILUMI_23799 [Ignelater luminosus]|uniref:Uncharacterized protein n=1 Tax=Ignelater luminosus TaxID=2038154 RepID=A0A8K0CAA6_IGNLU|nr:hypothetical protein ILUMI_23799 [Ignelater luminosus]